MPANKKSIAGMARSYKNRFISRRLSQYPSASAFPRRVSTAFRTKTVSCK